MRKLLVPSLCLGGSLAAQPVEKPLVSVSFYRVHPAKTGQWTDVARNFFGPMMDKLVAGGTVAAPCVDRSQREGFQRPRQDHGSYRRDDREERGCNAARHGSPQLGGGHQDWIMKAVMYKAGP